MYVQIKFCKGAFCSCVWVNFKGKWHFGRQTKKIDIINVHFGFQLCHSLKSAQAVLLHRFITPNHKSELCTLPRTPTPFKSAMEKYGPLQPLVSPRRFSGLLRWCHCCVVVVVMPCCVVMVSAADSKSGGRHQRGHPERHQHWPGGGPGYAPRAAPQNHGEISPLQAPFNMSLKKNNLRFKKKKRNCSWYKKSFVWTTALVLWNYASCKCQINGIKIYQRSQFLSNYTVMVIFIVCCG